MTLIPSDNANATVWGVAYKIKDSDIEAVTNHLDFREKNGYVKKSTTFYPKDNTETPFSLTLYVATEENESFAGCSLNCYEIIASDHNMLVENLGFLGKYVAT